MPKRSVLSKNILLTALVLSVSFGLSTLLQHFFIIQEHITTLFVFAVFLISLLTDGYLYGIAAAFISTFIVLYAFTFPYFDWNVSTVLGLLSAAVMIVVSLLTSTLTTKAKRWEVLKAEGEKERMRANLLRAVSHDLRTPLTTIYGSSSTILEHHDTLSDEQKVKMIRGIRDDAEWLVRMVENLLSVTRIDSGKVKIVKTPTVLEELIDSVIVKFRKRYPAQAVELELPDELVVIPMDSILIEQVLINILDNAVQHAAGMTKLQLRIFVLDNRAIFEISDNGCGIPKERMETLFSGYYGMEQFPADSQKRNAGIGLSVCATIIKAHGSVIRAENVKSGGAVFRFSLNLEEESNGQ